MKLTTCPRQRGFSLLEMMVVVTIILIMAAVATPSLVRAIRSYQLESAGRQVGNMVLRARYEALQRNRRVCAAFQRVGPEGRYGLDLTGGDAEPCDDAVPALAAGDPYMVTQNIVNWWFNDTPSYPPLIGLPAGYNSSATTQMPARFRITFSPRGTVVQPAGGGTWTMASRVQLICLVRNVPNDFDAVLVTITPVGRIKLYRWRWGVRWEEM